MTSLEDTQRARVIATLLEPDTQVARSVSAAALRAVCDAHLVNQLNLAQLVATHGVEYAGDAVVVEPGSTDTSPANHAELLHALLNGAADPADVAPEILFHARHAPDDVARLAVRELIDAARRGSRADVRVELQHALDRLPDGSEILAWLAANLLELSIVAGDPHELIADTGWIAVEALRASGSHRAAAESAFAASTYVDAAERTAFESAALELDPDGWGALVSTRRSFHVDDVDAATTYVRTALTQNAPDAPRLEITARTMLALMQSEQGATREAIANQRRAEALARQHGCWRELVFSGNNLAWMLAEQLDLVAARVEHEALEQLVRREGLRAFATTVATTGAGLAVLHGNRTDVLERLTHVDTASTDHADGAYECARVVEYLSVVDPERAAARVVDAQHAIARHGLVGEELQSALVACRIDPTADRCAELAGTLGGHATTLGEAQALALIARRRAIELDEHVDAALRTALERTTAGTTKLLDLARAEAAATRAREWRELREIAQTWAEHGFSADAALCRASAASLAWAAGKADDAATLAQLAIAALRDLDRTSDLARVHDMRVQRGGAEERADATDLLRLFDVDPHVRERIASAVERRTIARKHRLPADHLCTVVSGVATTHLAATDEPTGFVRPGMSFGTDRALGAEHAAAPDTYAVALDTCVVDVVPIAVLEAESQRSPQFARALAGHVALGVQRELQRARDAVSTRSEARLASLLLDLTDGDPAGGSGGLRMPQHTIGSLIGLSRERVSKAVAKLANDGLVLQQGQLTVVLDRTALQRIADAR